MNPINILLVDDEPAFVESLADRLKIRSFIVSTARNGQDALDRIDADANIEVVLLDLAMPGLDGLETLQRIKQKRPLVEIILLTGKATIDTAITAMKKGAFDYLSKPCDIEELTAHIQKAAGHKREREAKLLEIQMKPYISEREKNELIAKILNA